MDFSEIGELLQVAAATDNRTITDPMIEVWTGVLGRYGLAEAKAALMRHRSTSREYLEPIHIKTIIDRERRRRLESAGVTHAPDTDDPHEYIRIMRAQETAIVTGRPITAELLRPWRRELPAPPVQVRRWDVVRSQALTIDCPFCKVPQGRGCVSSPGVPLSRLPAHHARVEAADRSPGEGGQQPGAVA